MLKFLFYQKQQLAETNCFNKFSLFKSNPFLASSDIPIKLAIGVASAKAQGQAITTTETATINDFQSIVPS